MLTVPLLVGAGALAAGQRLKWDGTRFGFHVFRISSVVMGVAVAVGMIVAFTGLSTGGVSGLATLMVSLGFGGALGYFLVSIIRPAILIEFDGGSGQPRDGDKHTDQDGD